MPNNKETPDWLKRVVDEHEELCGRIWRLKAFLNTHAAPDDISCAARILLERQLHAMNDYKEILYVRMCLANAELSLEKDDNPAL